MDPLSFASFVSFTSNFITCTPFICYSNPIAENCSLIVIEQVIVLRKSCRQNTTLLSAITKLMLDGHRSVPTLWVVGSVASTSFIKGRRHWSELESCFKQVDHVSHQFCWVESPLPESVEGRRNCLHNFTVPLFLFVWLFLDVVIWEEGLMWFVTRWRWCMVWCWSCFILL